MNEAFAPQFLSVQKALDLDPSKTNVSGGAIALGHPLGGSGSRITAHLVHELRYSLEIMDFKCATWWWGGYLLFHEYECFACKYVRVPWHRAEEEIGSPRAGVPDGCNLPCGCWGLNPGSPERATSGLNH